MKRIAVIEDNSDTRFLLCVLLEDTYAIEQYCNGREAIEGLSRQSPDLAIVDISLPLLNGEELLSRIREHPQLCHLPVIALTAHAMLGDRQRFLDLGFDDYLSKPITDEQVLIDTIERCLVLGSNCTD